MKTDNLTTRQGVALMRAAKNGDDLVNALCRFYGASEPNELSRGELARLTETVKAFTDALSNPKDIKDIRLSLTVRDRAVELGRFGELDITLRALEMLEAFGSDEFDRIAVMLACIYGPTVQRALFPHEAVAKITAELADAWAEQVPFADSFALYDFFANWRSDSLRTSPTSLKRYMKIYRRKHPNRGGLARSVKRLLTDFRMRFVTWWHAFRALTYTAHTSTTKTRRCCCTTMQ